MIEINLKNSISFLIVIIDIRLDSGSAYEAISKHMESSLLTYAVRARFFHQNEGSRLQTYVYCAFKEASIYF